MKCESSIARKNCIESRHTTIRQNVENAPAPSTLASSSSSRETEEVLLSEQ